MLPTFLPGTSLVSLILGVTTVTTTGIVSVKGVLDADPQITRPVRIVILI